LTVVNVAIFDGILTPVTGPWDKSQGHQRKSGRLGKAGGLEDHGVIALIFYLYYVN
jgi:hypothetical protein